MQKVPEEVLEAIEGRPDSIDTAKTVYAIVKRKLGETFISTHDLTQVIIPALAASQQIGRHGPDVLRFLLEEPDQVGVPFKRSYLRLFTEQILEHSCGDDLFEALVGYDTHGDPAARQTVYDFIFGVVSNTTDAPESPDDVVTELAVVYNNVRRGDEPEGRIIGTLTSVHNELVSQILSDSVNKFAFGFIVEVGSVILDAITSVFPVRHAFFAMLQQLHGFVGTAEDVYQNVSREDISSYKISYTDKNGDKQTVVGIVLMLRRYARVQVSVSRESDGRGLFLDLPVGADLGIIDSRFAFTTFQATADLDETLRRAAKYFADFQSRYRSPQAMKSDFYDDYTPVAVIDSDS
ncbi:MAG: hypothetical protein AAFV53_19485 [Myxococcota bacterium]